MTGKHSGGYYNIGGGIENTVSLIELNNTLNEMMNVSSLPEALPDARTADQIIYISDIAKVKKDFNWSPKVSLESGLNSVIDWLEKDNLNWVQ